MRELRTWIPGSSGSLVICKTNIRPSHGETRQPFVAFHSSFSSSVEETSSTVGLRFPPPFVLVAARNVAGPWRGGGLRGLLSLWLTFLLGPEGLCSVPPAASRVPPILGFLCS